jgi:hypothetical protein
MWEHRDRRIACRNVGTRTRVWVLRETPRGAAERDRDPRDYTVRTAPHSIRQKSLFHSKAGFRSCDEISFRNLIGKSKRSTM